MAFYDNLVTQFKALQQLPSQFQKTQESAKTATQVRNRLDTSKLADVFRNSILPSLTQNKQEVAPKGTLNPLGAIGGFVRDVAQATPSAAASVTLEGLKPLGMSPTFTPKSATEKFLFGNEQVESVSRRMELAPERAKEAGIPNALTKLGPLAVAGFTFLDLVPVFGEGSAKIIKAIAASKDVEIIGGLLRKLKVGEDLIPKLSKDLVSITKPEEVKTIIQNSAKTGATLSHLAQEATPQLKVGVSRSIANEAIKFAKENPDSSLVAKAFRNPRTKELESGPLLFKRIGESIRNGEVSLDELPKIVSLYGLSTENTAKLFEDAATYSGRTLQALSRVEKELRALLPDFVAPKHIPTLWERFKSGYLAVDNFRRGLLVTQLATAARNAISQTGRYALGTITDGMTGAISKSIGKGEGFTPFLEDIVAVLRKMKPGNTAKLREILRKNPLESARLYNTPVGDVALTGKITNTLNAFNRGQEFFFRNLILDAKLNAAAKVKGIPLEKLGMDDFEKAVNEALEWTYSKSPDRGSFGDAIMRAYKAMPPLSTVNPFPRFMTNAIKFLYDYSPAGIMSLFSSKTRAAIAAGDYNAISKAIIGTSMLGAAVTIRAFEIA